MSDFCLSPIPIDRVLDEPAVVRRLIERNGPYYPVQRYVRNDAEHRAISAQGPMIIAPNFRGDWAYDRPLIDGAEVFLDHAGLIDAAKRLFDTEHVRPQQVYCNLTWQLPFHQGAGHTDVPAFRGIDRTRYPIWFLNVMGRSGLFESERIRIATAVAWFYEGDDGGFEYWPNGPDSPPRTHQGNMFNTAIMGDNDRMYHRVMPVGRAEDGLLSGMTLDTRLEHSGGDTWRIARDSTMAEVTWPQLRISVSWKAVVYRDAVERRMVEGRESEIDFGTVLDRFYSDLESRGVAFDVPDTPLEDAGFVRVLSSTYVRDPAVYA
jgi:hypothetical protein